MEYSSASHKLDTDFIRYDESSLRKGAQSKYLFLRVSAVLGQGSSIQLIFGSKVYAKEKGSKEKNIIKSITYRYLGGVKSDR